MSPSRWLDQLNGIAPIFIDAAVRGAIVLLVALGLTYMLRRRSAAARHLVWVGAIVVQLVLPLFAIWGPRRDVPISNRVSTGAVTRGPSKAHHPLHRTQSRRASLLLALWILGAVIVLARLAVGTAMVASLARKGARVDDGSWLSLAQRVSATLQIDRPLTLLRSDKLGVPVTWGIRLWRT
ncbi:MAG: M56 family metallopeptidase [Gemmatimonadaceae bacterium]